jgi:lysophospholipase L1-like esterase
MALGGDVNWMRIGLTALVLAIIVGFFSWPKRQADVDNHRASRQLILHYTLDRIDNPIIVLGDSIAEASTLPRSLCGHPLVNAGLSGASTASDLGAWLSGALPGKRAAMIVVSLGTNDAVASRRQEAYAANYSKLLAQLSAMASRVVVLAVPPIEARNKVSVDARNEFMRSIDGYNSALSDLARSAGTDFVALPQMPDPHTIDGVHLNAGGYSVWDAAILQAAASICTSN